MKETKILPLRASNFFFESIHFLLCFHQIEQFLLLISVDDQVQCEKWIRDDDDISEESKANLWLNRLIDQTKKVTFDWPFPFAEEKLFVLTLSAGLEGYHVNVDGRHVTSFPYRTVSNILQLINLMMDVECGVFVMFRGNDDRDLLLRMQRG
jgi:hypothetical protein